VTRTLCPGADEVRLYHKDGDRLAAMTTLRLPADGPRRRFACIGATSGDPCAVLDENDARVLVGTFGAPSSRQAMPFALEPSGDHLNLASLSPHAPRAGPQLNRAVLRADARPVALSFDQEAIHGGCASPERCVVSHGAQAWAAFSYVRRRDRPAVLVAGYLARGSHPEAPHELRLRAWRLVSDRGVPGVHQRCWIFRDGARVPLLAQVHGTDAASALASAWSRLLQAKDGDQPAVVC